MVGGHRPGVRDAYHALLKMPWWGAMAAIVSGYLILNALFALLYMVTGGVAHAAKHSFLDAFFFSVQTMGTIGYGAMYPETRLANAVVVGESVAGLLLTAIATGIVFVKFSQTRGRILFSERVAISPIDGIPTLMIRLGNERNNSIYDAEMRLTLVRTRRTAEGQLIYQNEDLKLVKDRAPTLLQSWMMLHRMDAASPLHRATPESLASDEAELQVALSGIDDTSLQPVHGRHMYERFSIVWGARLADVLSETPDGGLLLDLTNFHALEPTQPTAEFPYPRGETGTSLSSEAQARKANRGGY
jgi:inward rectifier potassium channel